MANSEFEYVRAFEQWDALPPSNWIVVRVDGRGFSKLSKKYEWQKPNDRRALDLLNAAAVEVVKAFVDVVIAYGQSDEYSFVFHEKTSLFERRAGKLATSIASAFTAEYNSLWLSHFSDKPLTRPYPQFDGRCVCYPKRKILRDYLSWRQADCHVNNLYNTTFWNLVQKAGMTSTEAELSLKGTISSDKNEILFSKFGINYNNEAQIFRKGTVLYRAYNGDPGGEIVERKDQNSLRNAKSADPSSRTRLERERKKKQKARIAVENVDIIGDLFWDQRPYILSNKGEETSGTE